MKLTQKALALVCACLLQACAAQSGMQNAQTSSVSSSSPTQSVGSTISIDGEAYSVVSSYYSALGLQCAIALSPSSSIASQSDYNATTINRFCMDSATGTFIRIRPLSQEW